MPETHQQESPDQPRRRVRDIPRLIKIFLLLLVILLFLAEVFGGEFDQLAERGGLVYLILLIKLLLIVFLIWLIRVQESLICDITGPSGCTAEDYIPAAGGVAVEVVGTASGPAFGHYTLEWRGAEGRDCDDDSDWSSDGVVYPGGGATGSAPVVNGTLGWINTLIWDPDTFEIRLCVYRASASGRKCCCTEFSLFKKLVWIERVAINPGAPVETPPGPFVATAPIVDPGPGVVVPVGGCVTIQGSAFVGECHNLKIKCFDLKFAEGFLPGPNDGGFNPAVYTSSALQTPVCYIPPEEDEKRAFWNIVIGDTLTTRLHKTQIELFGSMVDIWKLADYCFNSAADLAECSDPQHHCHSGKYTLLLEVEDTGGNFYYDTQHVWFDNKPIHAEFSGIQGLESCAELHIGPNGPFLPKGAPCSQPWPIDLLGIAYDEYIDENDTTYPSDNFDYYLLNITRQGGPTYHVPITPDLVTFGPNPLHGTDRVGDPGDRCELHLSSPCTPVTPVPSKLSDVLTKLDLRVFDQICAASLTPPVAPPAGFALQRGTCCGYSFQLFVRDKTWSDGWAGGFHRRWTPPWAVCICNDLPEPE